ncbi:MAG TPA: T9SS type A sorting domain-containing protein, partial [Flavobacteriales bacterium]|nr:T9SS type A sorting domain-containing protein [Flavobacteriales bacterium]
ILVTVEVCTGIEQRTANAIRVWPVPAGDELWLQLPPISATAVIVRDQLGRVVLQQRIGSTLLQHVDVAGWPAGLYVIELAGAGERAAVRFAKE